MRSTSQKLLLITLLGVGAVVVFLLLPTLRRAEPAEGGIAIHAPQAGAFLTAGETVTVIVEPSGVEIAKVFVSLAPGSIKADTTPPFEIPLPIPNSTPAGPARIKAVGIAADGSLYEAAVDVEIRPSAATEEIEANLEVSPSEILLSTDGQDEYITVSSLLSDGRVVDSTRSADTSYVSTNPKVATVERGRVIAVAPGMSTIRVTNGSFAVSIPVRVAVFELRGDLDGDNDVDQDDLNLLLSIRNTQATGFGDPRDLNNDGRIDALDARVLTTLCSRPRCATQ